MQAETSTIAGIFERHAEGAGILAVKIEAGPRSGVPPHRPRARVAVLCEEPVGREETLRIVGIVREAVDGVYRQPNISVMTSRHNFGWKKGELVL